MSVIVTEDGIYSGGVRVDDSPEFDQTARHDHGGETKHDCIACHAQRTADRYNAACFRCAVDGLGHEGDCDDTTPSYKSDLLCPTEGCRFLRLHLGDCGVESLPFASKTREAMIADVLRLDRDLHDTNKQLREARELVRQTQEDMSELCVLYARTGIELSNAEFRIKHLKTLAANGATITVKDLDNILNNRDAVPEYQKAA